MQRAVASVLHRVRRSDAEADDIARILVQGDTSANPMWRRRWDFAPIDRGGQPCRSLPKKRHEGTRNRTRVAIATTARLLSSAAGVRCGQAATVDRPIFRGWLLAICGATAVFITAASLLTEPTAAQAPQCPAQHVSIEQKPQLCTLAGQAPLPPTLNGQDLVAAGVIVNRQVAQQLGKALFWDIQIGSDGQACASCHFHAGADIRIANQANPGTNAVNPDLTFSSRRNPANGPTGPNKTLSADDFPFRQLTNVNNRNSTALYDSNDRFSSQGTHAGEFVRPQPIPLTPTATSVFTADDKCTDTYDPVNNPFHSNNLIRRKVEPRQTPSVINAVFNVRQFWDGRANNQFNGVDPFGPRTFQPPQNIAPVGLVGNPNAAGAGVLVNGNSGLALTKPLIDNSSLASQAVGPPLSPFEMSCSHRAFADVGRKMLTRTALALQKVHPLDSLFSNPSVLSNTGTGLNLTYNELIARAFAPQYWNSAQRVTIDLATGTITPDPNGYLQIELNFPFFFGLAVQEYEPSWFPIRRRSTPGSDSRPQLRQGKRC